MKIASMFLLFLCIFAACAHKEVWEPSAKEKSLYDIALKTEQSGDNPKTEEKAAEFLREFPVSRWRGHALLVLGVSQKNQNKVAEAESTLKSVVDFYQGQPGPDTAMALYQLALIYDGLGNDEKQMMALLQMANGLKHLPLEIAEAEWPARLAAAYARRGQLEQAREYSVKAEVGLKKLISGDRPGADKWLPKVYYSMGHISPVVLEFKNQGELEKFFDILDSAQTWLHHAAESGAEPWASKGAEELKEAYEKIWNFIEHLPPQSSDDAAEKTDPLLTLKDLQLRQRALAFKVDQLLRELGTHRVSSEPKNKILMTDLWGALAMIQKRTDILIGQKDVQDRNLKIMPIPKLKNKKLKMEKW